MKKKQYTVCYSILVLFNCFYFISVSPYSCHPNPCHQGGTCTKTKSLVFCTCPSDYKGHNCEGKACSYYFKMRSLFVIAFTGGVIFQTQQFSNEYPVCLFSHCHNHLLHLYRGRGAHLFYGRQSVAGILQQKTPRYFKNFKFFSVEKACVESPCMNDGICHETSEGFHCECNQGWKGHACDGKHCILI